jgi:alpha-D-xyloside xylohydrolase
LPTGTPTSTGTASRTPTSTVTPTSSFTVTAAPTATATLSGPAEVEIGAASRVAFDLARRELTLWRGATLLLRFPADALQLGRVDQIDDNFNYDPYYLYEPSGLYLPPEGLRWLSVEDAQVTAHGPDSFEIALRFDEQRRARLLVEESAAGRFRVRLLPDAEGSAVALFRLRPRVDRSEGFYGLGEYFDDVNHRGKLRVMQFEVDLELESGYNEAHVPIPFLIGTRGWGLFVETYYPGVFDVARQADDVVEAAFGTGSASRDGLTFHLFTAEHPLDVTKHYYDVTGYPRLPARWALGPLIWRDENRDQAQVEDDLNTIRDLDLAVSGVWIDRPYASAVNSFDFKPEQFPDPQAMIDLAHRLGMRMALWHTPYVDPRHPATRPLYEHVIANGFYPPRAYSLIDWGRLIDFTNPGAYDWWQGLIRRYTAMGIEGFKLDYAEDIVVGLFNRRIPWLFSDGSDERTMHARYQLFYHRVYAETLPDSGGFLLCRHSTWGGQTLGPIIWPGDLDASFAKHREVVTERGRTYTAVGGLPASMIAGIGLGPSGFPFYGSDTGGYRHAPPDKELFTRWFEQTALSSVMQIGTNTNDVAWEPTPLNGFDAEMLDWFRLYTRLHLRLFPYLWTYAQRIAADGRPIQRPMGLAYPDLGSHPWDQYMLGDDLLVAPVVERGQRQRQVVLPPGHWVDWWTGEVFSGGRITVDAPLDVLPLFIRAGGIIPLLRPTIDTLAPTDAPERVDSYATSPGVLYLRSVLLEGEQTLELFDGTEIRQRLLSGDAAQAVTLSYSPGSELRLGAQFEVQFPTASGPWRVESVTANGTPLPEYATLDELEAAGSGWTIQGNLHIRIGGSEQEVALTMLPQG